MQKRISVFEDSNLPVGMAMVRISPSPSTDDVRLQVTRKAQDRTVLGPGGWQNTNHAFVPLNARTDGADLLLQFGPELTRHLTVDMDVILSIPEEGISERHFWPEITPEPIQADGGNIYREKIADPIVLPVRDVPETPTQEDKEEETEDEGDADQGPEAAERPSRSFPWIWSLLVVLLIALPAVWYFGLRQEQPLEPTISLLADPAQDSVEPGFAERYELYRSSGDNAAELLTLAEEAFAAEQPEIAFKAMTLSADRNNTRANFELARLYDPLEESGETVSPNASNAAFFYVQARIGGFEGAEAALSRLCEASLEPDGPYFEAFASFDYPSFCQ